MSVLVGEDLVRREGDLEIVRGVSLTIEAGQWVSLMGPSGSGKTTLLQMLGLLDHPTGGRVLVDGEDAWALGAGHRTRLRLARLGFVFQTHNLIDHLSARENVALPAWRLSGSRKQAEDAADALLDRFGLASRRAARARVLSMGEAQRVAIARAIVNKPAVVLADEPTGALDSAAAAKVLSTLEEVCAAGAALLMVTHDPEVAARARVRLTLKDGKLEAS